MYSMANQLRFALACKLNYLLCLSTLNAGSKYIYDYVSVRLIRSTYS